jgi:hypothetical protein
LTLSKESPAIAKLISNLGNINKHNVCKSRLSDISDSLICHISVVYPA